jgi:hypothetical protein
MFNSKNINILQFNIILYNKVIVLEIFIQIFGMANMYFPKFIIISKK